MFFIGGGSGRNVSGRTAFAANECPSGAVTTRDGTKLTDNSDVAREVRCDLVGVTWSELPNIGQDRAKRWRAQENPSDGTKLLVLRAERRISSVVAPTDIPGDGAREPLVMFATSS